MDKQEAKLVLQALRPNDMDAPQPVFAEALALVASDPELQKWWEAQQAFDRKVAAKLKEIPIPDDLRTTIIASRKIEQFRPPPQFSYWLAAAAAVAIFCAVGTSQWFAHFGPLAQSDYYSTVLPLLNNDAPSLGMTSTDRDEVLAWLKSKGSPTGTLPVKMSNLSTYGCQKFVIHGHSVSLICFATPSGGVAHLFIVDEKALIDPPGNGAPEMWAANGWYTASWSDGKMSYVLATQASADVLKQLL
jgi:anti-sigma factor RsiW